MKIIKLYLKKFKRIKNLINNNFYDKNLIKKYNKLNKINELIIEYKKYKKLLNESKKILYIKEIEELINLDIQIYKDKIKLIKKNIKKLINKKNYKNKIYLEIKQGVGGNESTNFIQDLSKMYIKYLEKNKIYYKIMNKKLSNSGGYKEILIYIKGKLIFKKLKFESGVHRVQRLPSTENHGRIHTSTCRVAVFKKKNFKIKINKNDFKIETFKASGAGGQHVNKTNSAVRIKYIPDNYQIECQDERSQHNNKKKAFKIIEENILKNKLKKDKKIISQKKKILMGLGNRSEKIRTYNYQKNMLIDHRVNIKLKNLDKIMQGNLDYILIYFNKK